MALEAGANPNARPAMFLAVQSGHADLVALLLEYGAVTSAQFEGGGALDVAVAAGSTEIVNLLLDHGACPEPNATVPLSIVDIAAVREDLPMLALLLERGFRGRTAGSIIEATGSEETRRVYREATGEVLHQAAKAGDLTAVQALAGGGIPVDLRDHNDQTPLLIALEEGKTEVARWLLDAGADATVTDSFGRGASHLAVMHEDPALLRLVLDAGADATAPGLLGTLPIEIAAGRRCREQVDLLVERGAELTLPCLAALGDPAGIEQRLAAGVPVDEAGPSGETALIAALRRSDVELVHFLSARGANVNVVTRDGRTPLVAAVAWADQLVPLLLDAGADPNLTDGRNHVLFFALLLSKPELCRLLTARGAVLTEDTSAALLSLAVMMDRPEIPALVAAMGGDLNQPQEGGPALHLAASTNKPDLIRALLEAGAEVDAVNERGQAPVELALMADAADALAALLDAGASRPELRLDGEVTMMRSAESGMRESSQEWCPVVLLPAVREVLVKRGLAVPRTLATPEPPVGFMDLLKRITGLTGQDSLPER